ncbi:aldehyde dehydrogenase family protein [Spirosoma sp. KCTC 42546]|uniref:aldehyde dehydrogenase family protein n=1 Tax=Spirosoma sp. KCTC 42546 TaxID=2520506 RepID=UPI00115969C8|nr:aldehyde dehydrogenase family protein [Spirosoma sp. KCTC 42546]QDK80392.1 aldehyde dehydrogenase family protein [Spirosoma sp. KCTC 42546]
MTTVPSETDLHENIQIAFDRQRRHAPQMALTTAEQRIERIRRIQTWVNAHETDIQQVMYNDFRKPSAEVMLGELMALHAEITHTLRQLNRWMKPQSLPTPMALIGTKSHIRHEPKGNVLIISPWNYPFVLCIRPLVSAIGAGNVVMLKPSELTPHTSSLIRKMISELFPPEEVTVWEGDAHVSQALLELPFNHIFFTGSPTVGKVVMTAAAKHLASVTLELGGKSPAIVDKSADVKQAAGQLAWGKCLNNGQTCIAPDYLLVHESIKQPFMQAFRDSITAMYSPDGKLVEASESYARIVNKRHFDRIRTLVDDAVAKGATVTLGGKMNPDQNFIEPTVLENVTNDMDVMKEEIFGPVLPLLTYTNLDDALRMVNQREKPLALYIHSRNRKTTQYILDRTSAGDTVVNDTLIQFGNVELPFGGVNNSGLGKSNGFFSFQEFSNQRGVMQRDFGTMKFIYPPYTEKVKKLINFIVKYL